MTTPEFGSIQAMWSCTAVTPGVFSAMTLSPSRSRSSVIAPPKVTTPFATSTRTLARGAQSSLSSSAWIAALISASGWGPVAPGVAAKSPLRRSEREMTPTTVSPRSTGSRLMWRWIIRSTACAEVGVFRNRLDVGGHHLADLASVLMRIGLGEPSAAEQELEPMRALALASELAAAKEVAFAQDPDRPHYRRRRRTARSRASATSSRPLPRGSRSRARRSRHKSSRPEPAFSHSSPMAVPAMDRTAAASKRRATRKWQVARPAVAVSTAGRAALLLLR